MSDPTDAPPPAAPPAPAAMEDSPWAQLKAWRDDRVPREQWMTRLKASGLDDESARVLINSFEGVNPAQLPEASFSQGINPLAPGIFAVTDLGMTGEPATVGLYWMAFGGTIGLMVGVFGLLVWFEVVQAVPGSLEVLAKAMGTLALGAFLWGGIKVAGAVRVRRR